MDDIDLHYKVFMLMCIYIYIQYIDMHIVHPIDMHIVLPGMAKDPGFIITALERTTKTYSSNVSAQAQRLIHDRYSSET